MLKFLRKYNKWILVVGGSLLMIAFLVPQGINQLGSHKRGYTVFRLGEKKIRQLDYQDAAGEVQVVEALLGQEQPLDERDGVAHWILLTHAAEEAGLFGGESEGRDFFEQVAPAGVTVEQVAGQFRLQPSGVYGAMAKFAAVQRLRGGYLLAGVVSDRRAVAIARRYQDQVGVDLVLVPGAVADYGDPAPEESVLAEHFEKYRDARKGEGEYGLGYRLPQRVKVEWMTLERSAIEAGVVLDPVDVNKRWRVNRDKYPGEFEAERTVVEADTRAEIVDRALQSAHEAIRAIVYNATKGLEPEGRFKRLPPDWAQKRPAWEQVAQAVVARVNEGQNADSSRVVMPLPRVVVRGAAWSALEDLQKDPDLSLATVRIGNQSAPLPQVVMAVRELMPQTPLALQVGVPVSDIFATRGQDRLYFTVTEARDESPPDSLDEVRERVADDVRALRGLETLAADVDLYHSIAAEGGLQAVVDSFAPALGDPSDRPAPPLPEVRRDVNVSENYGGGVLPAEDEGFRKAVLAGAARLDPLKPVEQTPAPDRTYVLVSKPNVGLVVFVITDLDPVTVERLRLIAAGGQIRQAVAMEEFRELGEEAPDPFSYATLAGRYGWARVGGAAAEDEAPEASEEPAP